MNDFYIQTKNFWRNLVWCLFKRVYEQYIHWTKSGFRAKFVIQKVSVTYKIFHRVKIENACTVHVSVFCGSLLMNLFFFFIICGQSRSASFGLRGSLLDAFDLECSFWCRVGGVDANFLITCNFTGKHTCRKLCGPESTGK